MSQFIKLLYNEAMKAVRILCVVLLALISMIGNQACQQLSSQQTQIVLKQAELASFESEIIATPSFELFALSRVKAPGQPLVIYLEGDGHSMASKLQLSRDPTPHQPLALQLAIEDPRDNVIYLARPCQYTDAQHNSRCSNKYWSTHRFAKEVIDSTVDAMTQLKQQFHSSEVHLIGFSGGGGLAVLVAAQDPEVKSVMTVAGDLNLDLMRSIHQTSVMWGSKDPITVATSLKKVPQIHWSGSVDEVVPPSVAKSFVSRTNAPCVQQKIMPGFSHHKGWVQAWPDLIATPPACHET